MTKKWSKLLIGILMDTKTDTETVVFAKYKPKP